MTEAEKLALWALTLQIGHTVHGRLEDNWTKMERIRRPVYGQTRYELGIMTYYAFYISRTITGMELTGRMTDWKIRDFFEIIRTNFPKFYNPSQNLAPDEIIVKFKKDIFQTVHSEKTHNFRHRNFRTMRL